MPTCLKWGRERHRECTQTRDEGYNSCTATRDEGYSSCTATRDRGYRDCCDWWPCSWACKAWTWISNIVCVAWTWVSNIVCVAWTWVSNVVCVAWTWITTAFCMVWDVITTVVNAILVTLESLLGWVLSALAFIVELLQMIPVFGTFVRWLINGITLIVNVLISIPDTLLGILGIRPEKKLRVCTVILSDEKGVPVATRADVVPMLQLAADIYKRDANIRLIPSRPFKYDTGFAATETVDESWIVVDTAASDTDTLEAECNAVGEWLLGGTKFQVKSSTLCFFGNWRNVLGYGAPINCFVIRDVPGTSVGCSLFITDYVTVDQGAVTGSRRTIGHEIGHSCMLGHVCVDNDVTNLMSTQDACSPRSAAASDRNNPTMHDWQVLLVRTSKHVSYF